MQQQFSYYPSSPADTPVTNLVKEYSLSDGRIWYAALLPAISRFIEIYATNRTLGILVWALCVIMGIGACVADRKYVEKTLPADVDLHGLSTGLAVFPPAYMLKRNKILGERSSAGAVCIIMLVFAICTNGFIKGLTVTDKDFKEQIKTNYWNAVPGIHTSLPSEELIGNTLDNCADKISSGSRMKWSAERVGDYVTVTAKMDYDGDLEIVFGYTYDGYAAGDIEVKSFTLNGKTYKDSEAREQLNDLIDSDSSDESSEDSSEGSAEDDEEKEDKDKKKDSEKEE